MRLKLKIYRIANRFPDPERAEWTGPPWCWEVVDFAAPIIRLDGAPSLINWGYGDTWAGVLADGLFYLNVEELKKIARDTVNRVFDSTKLQ